MERTNRRFQQLRDILSYSFKSERGSHTQFYDVWKHDVRVVFGDLNFRLQLAYDIDTETVLKQLNSSEFDNLIKRDDLMVHGGSVDYLQGFQEGKIVFAPTYKYQIGTQNYDKSRQPAWCDRILWSFNDPSKPFMRQLQYGRAEVNLSDHKPVFGLFDAKIKLVDQEKVQQLSKELIAKFTQMKLQETENQIKEKIDPVKSSKQRSSQTLTTKAEGPPNVTSNENRPLELKKSFSSPVEIKDEDKLEKEESKSPVEEITDEAKFAQKVQEIKAEQKIISVGEALMDADETSDK